MAESAICSIDPDEGVLMYRGYDIAELAERSTYEETALLLLAGDAPSAEALDAFRTELAGLRELPRATAEAVDRQVADAPPMDVLRSAASTLTAATPAQLIARLPTIVARYHRRTPPTTRHRHFRALPKRLRRVVEVGAAHCRRCRHPRECRDNPGSSRRHD